MARHRRPQLGPAVPQLESAYALTISWPPVQSQHLQGPAFPPIRRRVAFAHQNRISNSPARQPSQPHRPETTLICVRPPTIGTHIQDEDLRRHILGPEDLPWKGTMNSSPRTADGWIGGSRRLQEEERTGQTQPCRDYGGSRCYRNGDEREGFARERKTKSRGTKC